jgi:hypothetical protein
MSNYSFELEFLDGEKSPLPFSSVARVYVQMTTSVPNSSHKYVTQDCTTASEFDFQINRLIKELENVRREAHKHFSIS